MGFISYIGACQIFYRGSPCVECITAMAVRVKRRTPYLPVDLAPLDCHSIGMDRTPLCLITIGLELVLDSIGRSVLLLCYG